MARRHFRPYRHDKRKGRSAQTWWFIGLLLIGGLAVYYYFWQSNKIVPILPIASNTPTAVVNHGNVVSIVDTQTFSSAQATVVARQNYGSSALPISTSITKITFRYSSRDVDGALLTIYGRVYIPENSKGKLPIFAFAPGTTGIGDQCAASLEEPQKVNWGNYDSHMIMYASQGYVGVTTDYEGMRDDNRMHHYMVGDLEGRVMLDSVLALSHITQTRSIVDLKSVFLSGYSQGGHAAFWADKLAGDYAPNLGISGVVGFGPVMSVKQTMGDVVYGANINWFGPYVLTSYQDYYKQTYPLEKILQPAWIPNLKAEVNAHCIDSDIQYWGRDPLRVYQPAFLDAYKQGTLASYTPTFDADLDKNTIGNAITKSAKRINQGRYDNVVLPRQQESILPTMCAKSLGPVQYVPYNSTHYDTMVKSLSDTIVWMAGIRSGLKPVTTCN